MFFDYVCTFGRVVRERVFEGECVVAHAQNGNQIESMANVGPLPNLQFLDLSDNGLITLDGLDQHNFLDTLLAARNQLSDLNELQVLQSLPRLSVLDLTGNPVQQVEHYRLRVIYMYAKTPFDVRL